MINFNELTQAMSDLDDEKVESILDDVISEGGDSVAKALEACQDGMNEVGSRFETGEYYVSDLIFAGELMTEAADKLKPYFTKESSEDIGAIVFCTVQHDLHDIGKNIVKAMFEAGGIKVYDLGVDVAPSTIVDAIKETGVKVLALSGVLTLAIDSMKATVDALKEQGMRDDIKVLIGGAPVTAEYCAYVGADDWSLNAVKSVNICKQWLLGDN